MARSWPSEREMQHNQRRDLTLGCVILASASPILLVIAVYFGFK